MEVVPRQEKPQKIEKNQKEKKIERGEQKTLARTRGSTLFQFLRNPNQEYKLVWTYRYKFFHSYGVLSHSTFPTRNPV